MRECFNDHPEVWEAQGQDLATVLREVADEVEGAEDWVNLTVGYHNDVGYLVTLYKH